MSAAGDVFLTFDDGPGPGTARVLDFLKKRAIAATFFLVGEKLATAGTRDLVERMARAGYTIGNHSYTHGPTRGALDRMAPRELVEDFRKCDAAAAWIPKAGMSRNARIPWIGDDHRFGRALRAAGYAVHKWDTNFDRPWSEDCLLECIGQARRAMSLRGRAVVLCHDYLFRDWDTAEGGATDERIRNLGRLVVALRATGGKFRPM